MVLYRNLRKNPRSKIKTVNKKKQQLDKLNLMQLNIDTIREFVGLQNGGQKKICN
mgnify:CR=1 FL=1|tara:strand:+ start:311 stop:475 length:165 start_codon:yes stop_codon:yes gene_type:complete